MLFISPYPKRGLGRIHLEPNNRFFKEVDKLESKNKRRFVAGGKKIKKCPLHIVKYIH